MDHTDARCSVAARNRAAWLLHAGGAYFFCWEMPPGEQAAQAPHCPRGLRVCRQRMEVDRRARRLNPQRLHELAAHHGNEVRIVSAHDAMAFERARAVGGTRH